MKSFQQFVDENYYTDGLKKISDLKKANGEIDKIVRSTISLFKRTDDLNTRRDKIAQLRDKVVAKYTKIYHAWAILQTQRPDFLDKPQKEKEMIKKVLNQSAAVVEQIFYSIVEKNVEADLKKLLKRGM